MISAKRLSASKLPLASRCAWWLREDAAYTPDDEETEQARRGTDMHALCAGLAIDAEILVVPEGIDLTFSDVYRDELRRLVPEGAKLIVERAYAWNPTTDTARELPLSEHREYIGLRAGELPGTVDLAWVHDGIAFVRDLKFGLEERVDPAATNLQLRLLGLAVARAHGLDAADVGAWFVDDSGEVREAETAQLDVFDLAAVADEVTKLLDVGEAPCRPGPHCHEKYCPARGKCPAHLEAAALALVPSFSVVARDAAHAAQLVELVPRLEAVAKAAREGAEAWAREHGAFPLSSGRMWGPREKKRETILATPEVLAVLEAEGVGRAVVTETITTITKEALEKACKAVAPRGKGAAKEREVLEKVGAAGGLSVSEWVSYELFPAPKPERKTKAKKELSDG